MTLDASGQLVIGGTSATSGAGLTVGSSNGSRNLISIPANSIGFTNFPTGGAILANGYGVTYFSFQSGGLLFGDSTTGTERARIDSSGNLLVGTTNSNPIGSNVAGVVSSPSGNISISRDGNSALDLNRYTSDGTIARFYRSATQVGSITVTTVATAYLTASDQRLKENIVDAAPASDLIDAIQVRQYDWKSDGSHQRYGFVAQELVTVAPEAVHQPADPEEMMAVDYSKLVPMLVKEIQDLRKRLAALEAK